MVGWETIAIMNYERSLAGSILVPQDEIHFACMKPEKVNFRWAKFRGRVWGGKKKSSHIPNIGLDRVKIFILPACSCCSSLWNAIAVIISLSLPLSWFGRATRSI